MDFQTFLKQSAEILKELDQYFKTWNKRPKRINPVLLPLVDLLQLLLARRQKVKRVLVKLGYQLSWGEG